MFSQKRMLARVRRGSTKNSIAATNTRALLVCCFDIPGSAKATAEKIEREQRNHQNSARKRNQPPINANGVQLVGPFGNERAPTRHGRLNAETEIAQERFVENDRRNREREV